VLHCPMSTTLNPAELSGQSSPVRRDLMSLLLSIAGGGVDAAMILGFNVLTAAQTGNTILLTVAFAERRLATGFNAAVSVIAFIIGSAVGELVIIGRRNRPWLSAAAWGLLGELIPLGALLACWHVAGRNPSPGRTAFLVVLAATAMGMQSTAALRIHAGPTTTYVTGTLTTFSIRTMHWLCMKAVSQSAARLPDSSTSLWSREGPAIYGVDWLVYAGGAMASALLYLRAHERALFVPIAAVLAAAVAGGGGRPSVKERINESYDPRRNAHNRGA
jgi:uncharacterized membrane protein YoaK (UPF0700 family)